MFFSNRYLTILAGAPITTAKGGTSLVTILPAPIIAPSPMVTPERTIVLHPIQTSLPIIV